jgi:acyl phosphate:glycerol-3-phosphate acyltransferase
MATLAFMILGYLLGSIPFAVVSSSIFGLPDPRSYGSGNPGATNVLRTGRKGVAALTLAGDAAKGWIAVVLAQWYGPRYGLGEAGFAIVALSAFLGHLYPVFLGFSGGKGVATAAGVLLALNPWLGLAVLATWGAVAAVWKISSLAAVVSAALVPVYGAYFFGLSVTAAVTAVMAALLIWRHRSNIRNLLSGSEDNFAARESQGGGKGH